ncbi:MAG TPA: substrate-binding domain-containing protein [Rhodopila sp.]|nr:substrate-binding domain-containing protein [Rhodopila sp.]
MPVARRGLFAAAPAGLAAALLASGGALAQETTNRGTTDLAVSCDLAAGPAVIAAGMAYRRRTGVRVRVFPTAPGLLLPQLQRDIQNDILVSQVATLDRAEATGVVAPGGRVGPWRNRLVMAAARQPAAVIGTFVVPDASPGSDIDGHAILQRLGVPAGPVIGVIDTGAVAWTLLAGGARQGLLHQTEVVADERLVAVSPVPDTAWPPILYAATVTKLARRGDPAAFVAFLGGADGIAALRSAGLESVS